MTQANFLFPQKKSLNKYNPHINQKKMGKHSEWRKLAKKARRKRIRQEYATIKQINEDEEVARHENSPTHKDYLEEQVEIEEFQIKEEERLHDEAEALYLQREVAAQKQWVELQKKLVFAKEERAKQNAKIKEEWDREQKRLKLIKEEKDRLIEESRLKQERLQERIEEFVGNNADMPDELHELLETNPGKQICPFFKKTGACRFNDTCSRNHIRPTINRVLLFRNFYSHYSLEKSTDNEHGSDSNLEFESKETYEHFKEFFNDILPEMEKFGIVRQLKVCCNRETHLRGNVYVEYSKLREAIKSYRVFQGRWYGGKQLNAEFCNIESWKSAICGLIFRGRCPKGSVCNFLHVFRNPGHLFSNADKDLQRTPPNNDFSSKSTRNCRWSESPERNISHENGTNSRRDSSHTPRSERSNRHSSKHSHRSQYKRSISKDRLISKDKRSISKENRSISERSNRDSKMEFSESESSSIGKEWEDGCSSKSERHSNNGSSSKSDRNSSSRSRKERNKSKRRRSRSKENSTRSRKKEKHL